MGAIKKLIIENQSLQEQSENQRWQIRFRLESLIDKHRGWRNKQVVEDLECLVMQLISEEDREYGSK